MLLRPFGPPLLPFPSLLSYVVTLFYDMPQLSSNRPDEETARNGMAGIKVPLLSILHAGGVDQTPSHLHILRYQLSTKSEAYTWLTIYLQESTFCDHALLTVFGCGNRPLHVEQRVAVLHATAIARRTIGAVWLFRRRQASIRKLPTPRGAI